MPRHPVTTSDARELSEPVRELGPGGALAGPELSRQLPHREQGGRGRGLPGQHRRCQGLNLRALDLTVLELAEAILQALQIGQDRCVQQRVMQGREELQHVPQLFAALAQGGAGSPRASWR